MSKPQRGLTTQLHDCTKNGSARSLGIDNREHVFKSERFEIETVTGVVIGRHRFGIAVDHDGFKSRVGQSKRRMNTGIVELDSLTDAVRSGTDDDDLRSVRRYHFGLGVVRRVVIRSQCREFARARVHGLEHGADFVFQTESAHRVFRCSPNVGELNIAEAMVLRRANRIGRHRPRGYFARNFVDERYLVEEPRVNRGCLKHLFNARTSSQRLLHRNDSTIRWST
ncbi:unannotated protein [freshwater metagenome]|uniref:Unannotated protein n=1 Tax=freshwater metagenome TaxID=449393 RepID=A0A6J6IE69_9ZZZZ